MDEAFRSSEFFDARDLVQVKYEMVRRVEADGLSVSAAAGAFGFSRQSYYTGGAGAGDEGLAGLVPAKPGPRGAHKLTDEVLDHLEGLREADPGLGAARACGRGRRAVRGHGSSPLGGASARPPGGRQAGPEKWLTARRVPGGCRRAERRL